MEIKKKRVNVYIINDKEFFTEEEAKQYEDSLKVKLSYTYYRVTYNPDLTEGRGYYNMMVVAVEKNYLNNGIYQYLMNTFGEPIKMVMGVSPIDNWIISQPYKFSDDKELELFLNEKCSVGIGDYRKTVALEVVYINGDGKANGEI